MSAVTQIFGAAAVDRHCDRALSHHNEDSDLKS